ncbi:MAG: hypothetical protein VB144_06505 [Clostridia bacterium]|nr:hypothetical protein [Clostridia bacterium]
MSNFVQLLNSHPLTLIMSLPGNKPDLAVAALDAGADVLKVHINVEHRASGLKMGSLEEERARLERILSLAGERKTPVGIVPGAFPGAWGPEMRELELMGFDFYSIYAHELGAHALTSTSMTGMVAGDHTYRQAEFEAMALAPFGIIEASVVEGEGYGKPLSWRDLLHYKNIVDWTGKPVVVPTQRRIRVEDLAALRWSGIRGLMLGAIVTGREASTVYQAVREFRAAIDSEGR